MKTRPTTGGRHQRNPKSGKLVKVAASVPQADAPPPAETTPGDEVAPTETSGGKAGKRT
tara:strand:- start:7605 stop:7781 length:177 start_codon:yes stop_codon:yes gene_type:complete